MAALLLPAAQVNAEPLEYYRGSRFEAFLFHRP